jgi:hypothetical protein
MLGLSTRLSFFYLKGDFMTEQYWQTKNGLVAVGDMTPDHLRNVLRQLIREKRILPPYRLKSAMLASIETDVRNSDVDTRHQIEMAEKEADDYSSQWDGISGYSDYLSYK